MDSTRPWRIRWGKQNICLLSHHNHKTHWQPTLRRNAGSNSSLYHRRRLLQLYTTVHFTPIPVSAYYDQFSPNSPIKRTSRCGLTGTGWSCNTLWSMDAGWYGPMRAISAHSEPQLCFLTVAGQDLGSCARADGPLPHLPTSSLSLRQLFMFNVCCVAACWARGFSLIVITGCEATTVWHMVGLNTVWLMSFGVLFG